jgi:hypothetical protein
MGIRVSTRLSGCLNRTKWEPWIGRQVSTDTDSVSFIMPYQPDLCKSGRWPENIDRRQGMAEIFYNSGLPYGFVERLEPRLAKLKSISGARVSKAKGLFC